MKKMLHFLTIMSLFTAFSCAPKIGKHDPRALKFTKMFDEEAAKRGSKATSKHTDFFIVKEFSYEPEDPVTIAYCVSDNTVEVLESYWNSVSDTGKEVVTFHELGHCALNRDHDSCPSVMCPFMIGAGFYQQNRTALLDRLFW